jgi:DHA1 family multidrug resistance protein-like MFS transporter
LNSGEYLSIINDNHYQKPILPEMRDGDKMKGTNAKFLVFLAVFTSFMGFSIVLPIFGPLIRAVGLSEFQAGVIVSVAALMLPLASPIWGKRSDRHGRKSIMLIGLLGLSIGFGLFTLLTGIGMERFLQGTPLFLLLLMARMVMGLFMAAVPATAQGYIADLTHANERSSGMAIIAAANGLGLILGPAIAGLLVAFGLLFPLYLGILLPFIGFLLMLVLLPAVKPEEMSNKERLAILQPQLWPFLLIGMICMVLIVALQINLGFYLQDLLLLTPTQTGQYAGMLLVVVGMMLVLTQGFMVRWLKWSTVTMLQVGLPLAAVGFLVMTLASGFLCILGAMVLMGIGFGLVFPAFMAGASLAVDEKQQGAVAGLTQAAQGVGAVIGPLFGTSFYQLDVHYPMILSCLTLCCLTVFVFVNRSIRSVQPL